MTKTIVDVKIMGDSDCLHCWVMSAIVGYWKSRGGTAKDPGSEQTMAATFAGLSDAMGDLLFDHVAKATWEEAMDSIPERIRDHLRYRRDRVAARAH